MQIDQIRVTARNHKNGKNVPLAAMALLALGISFAATAGMAATDASDAKARYEADRAYCNSGQSNQDRATCLKEAGAALQAARKGHLDDDEEQTRYMQNALVRCKALPPGDRDACHRRIRGEGKTSGSVGGGGVIRELVVPDNR